MSVEQVLITLNNGMMNNSGVVEGEGMVLVV